jgi:hypothetical protein
MGNYDPTDIRSQEREKADADLRAKLKRETEEADFKRLMSCKWGRRIVWRILDRAGMFKLSFNTNAMMMAFNEGRKNEGLYTQALIHTLCPELYHVMVREHLHDNRANIDDGSRKDH